MKKLFSVMFAIALSMVLSSCNNNDRVIDRYEQAINEGNYEEATSILYEIDEASLTREQYMRIMNISTGGAASKLLETMLKGMHLIGSALSEEIDESDIDSYMSEYESTMKDAFAPLMDEDDEDFEY